jgi:phenylpropionate dioxygenase-like ring-hydroxylating dioxygenase large terminal subunit
MNQSRQAALKVSGYVPDAMPIGHSPLMRKNLWYIVLPYSRLSDGLAPVRLLGQPFVAFRDSQGSTSAF